MTARMPSDGLTASDAARYLLDAPKRLLTRLGKYAQDPEDVEKRDRVLQQIDAMDQWLTVMRKAVCDGRLGLPLP